MPKRVIDFDAMWASDKLASCAEWAQSEYAWIYGLADASGSFEMTNIRVIWGRVAAIRKNLTLERLQEIFDEFIARGLLFSWEENGKRYGHWTGSDVPGRLPAPSWRMRLEKLAPPVPREELATYSARFGGSKEGIATGVLRPRAVPHGEGGGLKDELESAQGQDWDLDLEKDLDWEKEVSPPQRAQNRRAPGAPVSSAAPTSDQAADQSSRRRAEEPMPEVLLQIYEEERAALPPAGAMTRARRRRCTRWLAAGFTPGEFRAAVRLAAATPFLAGNGSRGWQASFDWLIANCGNVRKVLQGEYAPRGPAGATNSRAERRGLADLYTGMAPRPADCGVRVNPAALQRIRAREERLAGSPARVGCNAPETSGFSPQRAHEQSSFGNAEVAPKRIDCHAQPRAAPAALK